MPGIRLSTLALFFLISIISPMGLAKSVALKTINVSVPTDHGVLLAEIHFDTRDLEVALKVEKIIQTDLIKAINYFQYVPRNIVHFNVDPYMRLTNGNARVFPTNIINLYNFPPNNSEHLIALEDWLSGLVFHEYIHITHLDQTRGFLEVGRQIFGSFAKIPANIVPRWFTEGIAVWSESHLMKGGRLHNPLFRKELLIQFLRIEYCTTIDCLDEPGIYPNGQLAYWAGAHFMEYLENKKAGTIKCLVEENSSNVPFVLNRVFNDCAGGNAQDLFDEFRQNFINTQPAPNPNAESADWGGKISNAFGSDDLQKGILLDGHILYKVERSRNSEAFTSYDLQENVNLLVAKYKFPISDIVGITSGPSLDPDLGENAKFIIASFNEDPNFRENNRVWKLLNPETLLPEAVLPFKHDPSYVVGLGNHRFYTASFFENRWKIERQKVDLPSNTLMASDELYHFPSDINLVFFKKQGTKIFLKLHQRESGTTLYVSDLELDKLYKVYESKEFFDMPVLTDAFLIIREHEELKLVELSADLKTASLSLMDKNLLNRVTSAEISEDRILVLENRLKSKMMTPKECIDYVKKGVGQAQKVELMPATFAIVEKTEAPLAPLEKFPRLDHLLPHYWFLATGSSENLSSIGAMTTFSDPMDLNVLEATVLTYPSEAKMGGNLDFTHKFSKVSDLWSARAMFNHEYSKTDFSDTVNQTTEWTAGTYYQFLMKRWTVMPGIVFGATKVDDFISNRTTTFFGVDNILSYNALSFDDTFQSLLWHVKLQNDHPDQGESFFNARSLLKTTARFYEDLLGGLKFSYGKLFKTGFTQGVIYGGGVNTLSGARWHEFYGLPYSNAFGNEIVTARAHIDYTAWNIYRGYGFVPVFFKEAHLLLGREMMYADRIVLDSRTYRERTIHSFFAGARMKVNLFYYVPTDLDLIYSQITKPDNEGTANGFEINLNAEVF